MNYKETTGNTEIIFKLKKPSVFYENKIKILWTTSYMKECTEKNKIDLFSFIKNMFLCDLCG